MRAARGFSCSGQFEVILPVFEGDEAQVRQEHEANLTDCDAALIYYGAGNELWLRSKLRELQKIAGYGRTKPMLATGGLRRAAGDAGEGNVSARTRPS